MKYIDAEKLIAEIERLYGIARNASYNGEVEGEMTAYDKILNIITSLQQERGPHTESWIEDTKKELQHEEELLEMRLDTLKRIREKKNQFKQEQPEVDLKKEIERYINEDCLAVKFPVNKQEIELIKSDVRYIARHFYELGKNARKEK